MAGRNSRKGYGSKSRNKEKMYVTACDIKKWKLAGVRLLLLILLLLLLLMLLLLFCVKMNETRMSEQDFSLFFFNITKGLVYNFLQEERRGAL